MGAQRFFCSDLLLKGMFMKDRISTLRYEDVCPEKFFSIWGELMMQMNHQVDLVRLDREDDFSRYLEERGKLLLVFSGTESS